MTTPVQRRAVPQSPITLVVVRLFDFARATHHSFNLYFLNTSEVGCLYMLISHLISFSVKGLL